MKYHVKVHKEGKGFCAECIELSGCFTEADSIEELRENMEEALNLYIEEPDNSKRLAALPDDSISPSPNIIEVPVDPAVAFAFMVRYNRIQEGLTQQEAKPPIDWVLKIFIAIRDWKTKNAIQR